MTFNRLFVSLMCAGIAALGATNAGAQAYPSKPIHIVLSAAGGSSDIAARMIAPALTAGLGQPFIMDNKSGQLGISAARGAAPDGYTLLSYGAGLWIVPLMDKSVTYDAVKDFAPITMQFKVTNILVVNPSLPVNSTKELVALAKSKPGVLNTAAGSPGSGSDLASAMFNLLADVNTVRIPYKGAEPAILALLGNQAQLMFASPSTIQAHIKSGKVRALATTGAEVSPLAPDLPTIASTVPGFETETPTALFAPAGTPAAIITRLNREFVKVLNQPDIKDKLFQTGLVVAPGTPQELAAYIKADTARTAKVVKEAGLTIQ